MKAQTFWQYSLNRYSIAQVKDACLQLQDEYRYNVNLLLFCMLCDSLKTLLCEQSVLSIKNKIALSESHLIEHREERRRAKITGAEAATQKQEKQENSYKALMKQELALEAVQQEMIIDAFLLLNKNMSSDSRISQGCCHGSSLLSYLNEHNRHSGSIDHKQQVLIDVLRKHV
jgi:uncharacterized protein (TIGR02444 family)